MFVKSDDKHGSFYTFKFFYLHPASTRTQTRRRWLGESQTVISNLDDPKWNFVYV